MDTFYFLNWLPATQHLFRFYPQKTTDCPELSWCIGKVWARCCMSCKQWPFRSHTTMVSSSLFLDNQVPVYYRTVLGAIFATSLERESKYNSGFCIDQCCMSWKLRVSSCWLQMFGLPAVSRNADNFMNEKVNIVTKVIFLDGVFFVV